MSDLVRREDAPEAQVLERMTEARTALAAARTVLEAKRVADMAAVICEWLRRQVEVGLEIVNDGLLLKIQAEARMGEFLNQPGAVRERGRRDETFPAGTFRPPTHKELGIARVEAHRFRQVAAVPGEVIQDLADQATRSGKELTRREVLRTARRLQAREMPPPAANGHHPADAPAGFPEHLHNRIVTGDARLLAREIPAASITLCVADPVWERTQDYEWLARECERVLIPGGSLIVQAGTLRRYECETALRRSGLAPVDLLAEVYPYALSPLRNIRVQVGWKPHLWFSRGPRLDLSGQNVLGDTGWLMNRVHAKGKQSANGAKDLHAWGDAEEFTGGLLERLCRPGDLVWDPFTGSGTVPVVARRLGLPFVAFEIDPETAALARDRLQGISARRKPQLALEWAATSEAEE